MSMLRDFSRKFPLGLRRRVHFLHAHRRWPNLRDPKTFNEKVNWRILNDRRELLSWTCDKLKMKEYALATDSNVKVPRTLWSGNDLSELNSYSFPDRWILKANHRSQCVYPGESRPDIPTLIRDTEEWMGNWQADHLGEWAYRHAEPLFILEEWIGDGAEAPNDLKFFVFDGRVKVIQLDEDRFSGHRIRFYSPDWTPLAVSKKQWGLGSVVEAPSNLKELISIAENLGAPFDFIRIDLFNTSNGAYFGETTPYPGGGLSSFEPKKFDRELGEAWVLPLI